MAFFRQGRRGGVGRISGSRKELRPRAPWDERAIMVESSSKPLQSDLDEIVSTFLAGCADKRGVLLPLLHEILERMGHVPDVAIPVVAQALNLSRAEVHGVVSFYHDFRREPPGRHIVKICRAEACKARGSDAIERAAVARLGTALGETRSDGRITLEAVYCLGLCGIGPNMLVDGVPLAKVDEMRLDALTQEFGL